MLLSVRRLQPVATRINLIWRQKALRCYSTGEKGEHDPLKIVSHHTNCVKESIQDEA